MTRWTFRHVLLKRADARDEVLNLAKRSECGGCEIAASGIGRGASEKPPCIPTICDVKSEIVMSVAASARFYEDWRL